jgi:hypothetical protein
MIIAGRLLQRQRGYNFCVFVAAVSCIQMPLGTVLGVFTLIVLLRPSVKELFGRGFADFDPDDLDEERY